MRKAVQITGAALIAAVLMTGCGSESGGDKKDEATPAADAPKQTPGDAPAKDPAKGPNTSAAALAGAWSKGKLADKSMRILSFSGNAAALNAMTYACAGKVVDNAQPVTLTFNCKNGNTEYAQGTVKSVNANSLTIAWASGKEDTFSKSVDEAGKPNGLPAKPSL
ncbi:hypothetical protein [Streptomyces sp. ISL-11]|uniref:hypothetical protein n=1 Tax=Streptomyces sp. ISL-11 TaxID=2819174 RepID=UPI001BE797E2|nr:hypothetical protein [Streptomyces sp. ISL-11]MBT2384153.1 hypothetical protein [Streptomyces sp. ISL-11]